MVSLEEKYQNFKSTIEECGSYLLTKCNDIIEYNLFEEFSVDVISFLHEDVLNIFLDEGMIDNDILEKSMKLRSDFLQLEKNPNLFSAEIVKTSDIWKSLLKNADDIRELLYW